MHYTQETHYHTETQFVTLSLQNSTEGTDHATIRTKPGTAADERRRHEKPPQDTDGCSVMERSQLT